MRKWSRVLGLGSGQMLFLLRCLAVVTAVRLGLSLRRHDAIRRRIEGLGASQAATLHELRLVSWGITAAARLVPGASCLTQALAGQYLLARRGKGSFVRIGVEQDTGAQLKAHAWLISGGQIVLGGTTRGFSHLVDYGS